MDVSVSARAERQDTAGFASVILLQGTVWYMPGELPLAVIKECAAVPNGRYDDWADTVTMAMIWSRDINLLEVPDDLMEVAEEGSREREETHQWNEERPLYGPLLRQGRPDRRSLYGRTPGQQPSKECWSTWNELFTTIHWRQGLHIGLRLPGDPEKYPPYQVLA